MSSSIEKQNEEDDDEIHIVDVCLLKYSIDLLLMNEAIFVRGHSSTGIFLDRQKK
jgi:hypothetical protein